MDFSKDFRTFWWGTLIICMGYYLVSRLEQLQAGKPTWFDALVFIVWIALALGPFFKEMEFLGFKLKQEVAKLKEHVTSEIASIRTTIQTTVDQRQSVTSSLMVGYPPPLDSQLSNIQEQIRVAVREAVGSVVETQRPPSTQAVEPPPDETQLLFAARLALEKELRIIHRPAISGISDVRRFEPIQRITEALVRNEVITPDIGHAIREVYSVCSLAVHGEDVSPAKVDFVRNTAPELISALKVISSRYA